MNETKRKCFENHYQTMKFVFQKTAQIETKQTVIIQQQIPSKLIAFTIFLISQYLYLFISPEKLSKSYNIKAYSEIYIITKIKRIF